MPTRDKSISDCQMYIIRPDGTEAILGEIQSAEIVGEQPSNSLQDCHDLMISWLRMHGYRPERKHR